MDSDGSVFPPLSAFSTSSEVNNDENGFTRSPKTSFSTRSDYYPLGPTGSLKITGSLSVQDAETASEADSNDSDDGSLGNEAETKDQDTGAEEPAGGDSKQPKEEQATDADKPAGGNPEQPKEEEQATGAEKPAEGSAQVAQTIDVPRLFEVSKKVTGSKRLTFFHLKPQLDPLARGPLGINAITYEAQESAVGVDVVPYWMCVTTACFKYPEVDTLESLKKWSETLGTIEGYCVDEEELKAEVKAAVDETVRIFAKDTFLFIDTIQALMKLKRRYNPRSDIKTLFERFFVEVNEAIDAVMRNFDDMIRLQRQSELLTNGFKQMA
jgi:hypothetical protein